MTVNVQLTRMLVPTAGKEPAKQNAKYIMQMAHKLQAEIIVIHIRDYHEERRGEEAIKIFEDAAAGADVPLRSYLLVGDVVDNIVDITVKEKINLIVMGGSQDRIAANWIVTKVLEKTKIPVVIIPFGLENLI